MLNGAPNLTLLVKPHLTVKNPGAYYTVVLPELPVLASMLMIAYQDFRYRLVDDWAFVPAIAFIPLLYWLDPGMLVPVLMKAAILGGFGLAIYFFGLAAQADAIVLPLLALSTDELSPMTTFLFTGLIAGMHVLYVMSKYRKLERVVDVESALKDDTWIPKKVIEEDGGEEELPMPPEKAWKKLEEFREKDVKVMVSFGTPLAGYFALGYLAHFLLMLII